MKKKSIVICPECGNEQEVTYRKAHRCQYCMTSFVLQGKTVKIIGEQRYKISN